MTGKQLFEANIPERKNLILDYSNQTQFTAPSHLSDKLKLTFQVARALDSILPEYFDLAIQQRLVDFQDENKKRK